MSMRAWRVVLLRDVQGVRAELAAYDDEAQVWSLPPGLPNSAGTLALHLAGNLQHFIGAVLGGTGYARDRDGEFGDRDVPRTELDTRLATAAAVVERTLSAEALPESVTFGTTVVTTDLALAHLTSHLAYHLGQIDYHRRIVTGSASGVGTMSIKPLA